MYLHFLLLVNTLVVSTGLWGSTIEEVDSLQELSYPLLALEEDSAYVLADMSLEMAQKINYDFGIANSYYIKAYLHQHKNEPTQALILYLKASQILQQFNDYRSIHNHSEVLLNLGVILRKYGKYKEAHQFMDQSLSTIQASKSSYPLKEIQILYNKALLFRDEGKYDHALEILHKIIPQNTDPQNMRWLINCWNLSGIICLKKDQFSKSREFFRKMLSMNPSHDSKGLAYHNIGDAYFQEGKYDSAEIFLWMALEEKGLETKEHVADDIFVIYKDLCKVYLKAEDNYKSIEAGLKSLGHYRDANFEPDNYIVFKYLSQASHNIGDDESSYQYSTRYYEENEKYQKRQDELMRLRDELKIDVFLDKHYNGQDSHDTAYYRMTIWLLILGLVVLVMYQLKAYYYKQ